MVDVLQGNGSSSCALRSMSSDRFSSARQLLTGAITPGSHLVETTLAREYDLHTQHTVMFDALASGDPRRAAETVGQIVVDDQNTMRLLAGATSL